MLATAAAALALIPLASCGSQSSGASDDRNAGLTAGLVSLHALDAKNGTHYFDGFTVDEVGQLADVFCGRLKSGDDTFYTFYEHAGDLYGADGAIQALGIGNVAINVVCPQFKDQQHEVNTMDVNLNPPGGSGH